MASRRILEPVHASGIAVTAPSQPVEPMSVGPLKIVHVITRLLLGGAEENTVATCLHQAACGHRVILIHGPGADPAWAKRIGDRVELVEIGSMLHPIRPLADLRALGALHRFYRRIGPDIVHTHESKAGILGRLAAATAHVPLIVHTIHIAPFVAVSGAKRRLYVATERFGAKLSHVLIGVSRGMQQAYLDARIGDRVPIAVIHSGMPLDRFTGAIPPADWRARIGGWHDEARPRFILKIAAFEERKRQRVLLIAMADGLRQRRDLCLLFAGDGPDREVCAAEAQALGIADQVRFLGHDPAPWELVALADVCVHAAAREGLPRSAVQAIAGGKPLVVARLPGIEEVVGDGINGIIADPDDLGDLAARLFALLDSPERVAQLQAGARATDVSSWCEEKMGQRIDTAYALARNPPPRPIASIEFLGLPGAGKTTIARELVALIRERRANVDFSRSVMGDDLSFVRRSLRRLWLVTRAALRAPRQILALSRGLAPENYGGKDAAKTRWNFVSVLAMHLCGKGDLMIADQGVAQAIWTARTHHGPGAAPAAALIDGLEGWIDETLFVLVDVPTAIARRQIARREQVSSRFQKAECIDDDALWSRGQAMLATIEQEIERGLARRGLAGRFLRVTASDADTPHDRAVQILDHLELLNAGTCA